MPKRIDNLTPEQERGIWEWQQHCLAIGRDTSPIDKDTVEKSWTKFYEILGKKKPLCLNDVHARVSVGYAFDAEETTVLGHPEHDNYVFKFRSRWQVVHQIDLRTLQRAAD